MKKIGIVLCIILLVGCGKQEDYSMEKYFSFVSMLQPVSESSADLPFSVEIKTDVVDNEIMYQVIIDKPVENLYNITAIAITEDVDNGYPSIGIFDESVNLLIDEVDSEQKKPKGIALVGWMKESLKHEIKILVQATKEDGNVQNYYVVHSF